MDSHFVESEIGYIDENLDRWENDLKKISTKNEKYSNVHEEIFDETRRLE